MLRIFATPLVAYYLHMHTFTCFFIMWDYVFVLKCVGDVALRGASDSNIKSKLSIT